MSANSATELVVFIHPAATVIPMTMACHALDAMGRDASMSMWKMSAMMTDTPHAVSRTHDTLAHVLDAQGRRVSRHDLISDAYAEAERLNGEGMSKIEDGGPAFPILARDPWKQMHSEEYRGLTMRDWFAGQALTGLLASGKWDNVGEGFDTYISNHAINIADAMLAARKP